MSSNNTSPKFSGPCSLVGMGQDLRRPALGLRIDTLVRFCDQPRAPNLKSFLLLHSSGKLLKFLLFLHFHLCNSIIDISKRLQHELLFMGERKSIFLRIVLAYIWGKYGRHG